MSATALALFATWTVVFVMNAVTLPLPPAWMVLAAVHTTIPTPLLPLTIGGSAAAALGRGLFSRFVAGFTGRLPATSRANAEAIATAAHARLRWPWLFVVIYSLLPISSDGVFVAVGLGALPATSSLIAFFLARSVFNTLMVTATGPVAKRNGPLRRTIRLGISARGGSVRARVSPVPTAALGAMAWYASRK